MLAPEIIKKYNYHNYHMVHHFHFWVHIQKNLKWRPQIFVKFMFPSTLFTITKTWKQLTCLLMSEWISNHFHVLEKEMATHSSVLAWRILGTGEPGGLPSMGSHRVGHD